LSARIGAIALLAALMAAGTWLVGWWGLLAAAVLGQLIRREAAAWHSAVASLLGWGMLFLLIPPSPLERLTDQLGGILRLPPWATVMLALSYASLLGWSGARLVRALRSR
jgi:hypothetical protein